MTPSDYVKNVLKTESKDNTDIMKRLDDTQVLSDLKFALRLAMKTAEVVDLLKRAVFYGKPVDPIVFAQKKADLENLAQRSEEVKTADAFDDNGTVRLLHAALGMTTESVEVVESIYKHAFEGKELDRVNIKEEIGDALWYVGVGVNELNTTFEEVCEANIAKLKARYGDKFSEEKALNRNLKKERKVLEG